MQKNRLLSVASARVVALVLTACEASSRSHHGLPQLCSGRFVSLVLSRPRVVLTIRSFLVIGCPDDSIPSSLEISLVWTEDTDLDLHVFEPGGKNVYFGERLGVSQQPREVNLFCWHPRYN